jgi:hypothetical protein
MRSLVACLLVFLCFSFGEARADVQYDWFTTSATVDGVASSVTPSGEITLTDAAFAQGSAQVTSLPPNVGGTQTSNGIVSASFQFIGPFYTLLNSVVNFAATVDGQYLDIDTNNAFGGFFVDAGDTAAYYAVNGPGAHMLTVGFGTDFGGSPCYGPQEPSSSQCVATGYFEVAQGQETLVDAIPEPGTMPILLAALGILTPIVAATRFKSAAR